MINFPTLIPCSGLSLVSLQLGLSFPYPYLSQTLANCDGFLSEWVYFIDIIIDCILISIFLINLEIDLFPQKIA